MNKKPMTYEEAQAQLEAIVSKVENNEFGLDELGDQLRKALELVAFCKERLVKADQQIKSLLHED